MTTHNGWRNARGHIVFLLALVTAFAIVYWLEQWETGGAATTAQAWTPDPSTQAPPPPLEPLSDEELAAARTAWAYFEGNTQPDTGLVNSVAGYPATTMWDTGGYLLAAISAERLGLLPREEFDRRMTQALDSLVRLPLYDGRLPNKSYDTTTLAMTDYANIPTEAGIGWSALDIGRLLVPLEVLLTHYPEHAAEVAAVLDRWNLSAAVGNGELIGAQPNDGGGVDFVQEGRLGYEQYGARGFELLGYDTGEASRVEPQLDWAEVEGVEVPVDRRDPEEFGAHTHTLSEPYILAALEYGWDTQLKDLAWRVYEAQERRHTDIGLLTAVTEDHLDRAPHFIFSSVIANGEPWAVQTDTGEDADAFRILSTKAALGWHALYRTPYTEQLTAAVWDLQTPNGWQAGHYETLDGPDAVLASNTNAVILEALHYWAFGPILHPEGLREQGETASAAAP
ncbi:hypothetical protein Rumeso_02048 [Rubellimicrobium mesophilum DSM 19309]|uniref:DUF3131 domain-containing protein n=1 Tax=Rubellimicrobium mesophilum DSM 19309 TaxID=442562 RepID=A0A017HRJ1_9RHOB|nr:DUF3131 domain-containing protein [Rubellimicrobium mesophilum]EYD76384.1 hypothetical protein Rumeso_02048 [Rubellimicrobium mesophilum DSM 19309]